MKKYCNMPNLDWRRLFFDNDNGAFTLGGSEHGTIRVKGLWEPRKKEKTKEGNAVKNEI